MTTPTIEQALRQLLATYDSDYRPSNWLAAAWSDARAALEAHEAQQPVAYLLVVQNPGEQTSYASVDSSERRDGIDDRSWIDRKVIPLYTKEQTP